MTLHWSSSDGALLTDDGELVGSLSEHLDDLTVDVSEIGNASLAALFKAMGDASTWRAEKRDSNLSETYFNIHVNTIPSVSTANPDRLFNLDYYPDIESLTILIPIMKPHPSWTKETITEITNKTWGRFGDEIIMIHHEDLDRGSQLGEHWEVSLNLSIDDRSVYELAELSNICRAQISLPSTAPINSIKLDFETTWDVLMGGQFDYLIGQKENSWFDVKSAGYDLSEWSGKIELSQDIARFANAETGGILVCGFRTKRRLGNDIIEKITPIEFDERLPPRYQAIIDRHVYPPIDGLQIELIRHLDRGVLAIRIPPQNEENKWYLVHGAIVEGKYEGAFISIVRRRGEGSIPITSTAIHAYLSAGRKTLNSPTGPV